jgi:hypothetical protein
MSKGPWKHKSSVTRSLLALADKMKLDLVIDKNLNYRFAPKGDESEPETPSPSEWDNVR